MYVRLTKEQIEFIQHHMDDEFEQLRAALKSKRVRDRVDLYDRVSYDFQVVREIRAELNNAYDD